MKLLECVRELELRLGIICILLLETTAYDPLDPGYYMERSKPRFLNSGRIYEKAKGSAVELECSVGNLGDNTVVWKQGERVISAGNVKVRKDDRISLVDGLHNFHNSHLRIENIQLSDAGNYTCEIEWGGKPQDLTHVLRILQAPKITQPHANANIHVKEGEPFNFACMASGDPRPQIKWQKKIQDIYTDLPYLEDPSVINIKSVSKEDDGEYLCEADNNVGTDYTPVHLHIHYTPEVQAVNTRVYSGVGGHVELRCLVEGYPQPVVNWYQAHMNQAHSHQPSYASDVRQIIHDRRRTVWSDKNNYYLKIKPLTSDDLQSNFSCEASNEIGRAMAWIEVTGRPEPPYVNSPPESLHENSYRVTFTVKSFSPLTYVEISYRLKHPQIGGEEVPWTIKKLLPSDSLEYADANDMDEPHRRSIPSNIYRQLVYVLDGLSKKSKYGLIIKVENQFGWSEPSQEYTFTTREKDYSASGQSYSFFWTSAGASGNLASQSVWYILPVALLNALTYNLHKKLVLS